MLSVRFKRLSPSKDDRALRGEAAALIWGDGIWLTRPRSSRGFKAPNPVVSGRGFWSRTAAGGAARWAGAADSPPPPPLPGQCPPNHGCGPVRLHRRRARAAPRGPGVLRKVRRGAGRGEAAVLPYAAALRVRRGARSLPHRLELVLPPVRIAFKVSHQPASSAKAEDGKDANICRKRQVLCCFGLMNSELWEQTLLLRSVSDRTLSPLGTTRLFHDKTRSYRSHFKADFTDFKSTGDFPHPC